MREMDPNWAVAATGIDPGRVMVGAVASDLFAETAIQGRFTDIADR
jgi:hypothetical protein